MPNLSRSELEFLCLLLLVCPFNQIGVRYRVIGSMAAICSMPMVSGHRINHEEIQDWIKRRGLETPWTKVRGNSQTVPDWIDRGYRGLQARS